MKSTLESARERASQKLNQHYRDILNGRKVTTEEVKAEAVSLMRKHKKGTLDSFSERLFCSLPQEVWETLAKQ